jgi:pimeloyl-ACP methyl ester carboxylesterase
LQSRRAGIVNDFSQVYLLDKFPYGRIKTPTLIIHAQDDSLVSIKHARNSTQIIPDARLISLSKGGHLLLGQRSRIQSEVGSFLQNIVKNES